MRPLRGLLVALSICATLAAFADTNPSCPLMNSSNVYIESSCDLQPEQCRTNVPVQFAAAGFGYNFSCGTHTFAWDFGDGSTFASSQSVQHTFALAGVYNVSVTITNAQQTYRTTASVRVNSSDACPAITSDTFSMTTDCSRAYGVCRAGTAIDFGLSATNYSFACATHSFYWNFGDGAVANTQNTSHTYAEPGTYTASVTINNGAQTYTIVRTIDVASSLNDLKENLLGDAGRFGNASALDQWTQHGLGTVKWSSDSAGDQGSGSAELIAVSSDPLYISRVVPVRPGRSYVLQSLIRNAGSVTCSERKSFYFMSTPNGPVLGGVEGAHFGTVPVWDPLHISGMLGFSPPDAAYAELRLYNEGPPGCTLHYSDVGFYEMTPEIKSFTSSSTDVVKGSPVRLSWTVANATRISVAGTSLPWYKSPGSIVVYPTETTTYTLNATTDEIDGFGTLPLDTWRLLLPSCVSRIAGSDSASVTVHVTSDGSCPPLDSIDFTSHGTSVGQPVTFQAYARPDNTSLCSRFNFNWTFGDGASDIGPAPTHTYAKAGVYLVDMRVHDSAQPANFGTALVEKTVAIGDAPIGALSRAYSGRPGDTLSLFWTANVPAELHSAEYAYFNDRSKPIGPVVASGESGTYQVVPAASISYVLTGAGGTPVLAAVPVEVNTADAPVIVFNADTTSIHSGDPVVLSWSVTGADCGTAVIDNGVGPLAYYDNLSGVGSATVAPKATVTYTLTASNSAGITSKSVTVVVDGTDTATIKHFAGVATTSGASNGTTSTALFNHPAAAGVDSKGYVYVVDAGNHAIRRIKPDDTVETYAGQLGVRGKANGYRTQATFDFTNFSGGFIVRPDGSISVWDTSGRRDIDVNGNVTGGNCNTASCGRYVIVSGIVQSANGVEYWSDSSKHLIWQKPASSSDAAILAGDSGMPGFVDGRGSTARFNSPKSIAIDADGNLYVSDAGNEAIRKVTPDGRVSTYAGRSPDGGYVVQGSGALSVGSGPLVVGPGGVLYVVDSLTNSVKKILPDGSILTVVGSGTSGSTDGAGASGTLNDPEGISSGGDGSILVSDSGNHEIRTVKDTVPPPCPVVTAENVAIDYENAAETCRPSGNDCSAGETLYFTAKPAGFSFLCAPHTFQWDFGDGSSPVTGSASQTHAYSRGGEYTVSLAVTRNGLTTRVSRKVTVIGPARRRPMRR